MEKVSAFQFEDYRSFLRAKVDEAIYSPSGIKRGNLEKLASKLGYKSPSSLSMILKGDRLPSDNMFNELVEYWGMTMAEKEYLRGLVQLEKARKRGKDFTPIVTRLKKINKKATGFQFTAQDFEHIQNWYFLVIKELAYTPEFRDDPQWIARRLRRKITPAQAKHALETLERLNVLQRDAGGALRPALGFTESSNDIPSHAIRQHHKGMLQRAIEAVDEQTVDARHFGALTLRLNPKDLPKIKEGLMKFLRSFHFENESSESNSIYQLSLQLFEHTKEVSNAAVRGNDETVH